MPDPQERPAASDRAEDWRGALAMLSFSALIGALALFVWASLDEARPSPNLAAVFAAAGN